MRHVADGVFIKVRRAACALDDLDEFLHVAGDVAVGLGDDGNVFKALYRKVCPGAALSGAEENCERPCRGRLVRLEKGVGQ